MIRKIALYFCTLLLTCTLAAGIVRSASAQTLQLSDLVIDNQAGMFMARFGVGIDGLGHVAQVLEGGVSVTLFTEASLVKKSSFWRDEEILQAKMQSRLQYDPLQKKYSLELPGTENPIKERSLEKLIKQGWSTLNMELGPWQRLQRDEQYSLRLKIELRQTDIPNWFERTLVFWSWDVAPTTSYQLDFSY